MKITIHQDEIRRRRFDWLQVVGREGVYRDADSPNILRYVTCRVGGNLKTVVIHLGIGVIQRPTNELLEHKTTFIEAEPLTITFENG